LPPLRYLSAADVTGLIATSDGTTRAGRDHPPLGTGAPKLPRQDRGSSPQRPRRLARRYIPRLGRMMARRSDQHQWRIVGSPDTSRVGLPTYTPRPGDPTDPRNGRPLGHPGRPDADHAQQNGQPSAELQIKLFARSFGGGPRRRHSRRPGFRQRGHAVIGRCCRSRVRVAGSVGPRRGAGRREHGQSKASATRRAARSVRQAGGSAGPGRLGRLVRAVSGSSIRAGSRRIRSSSRRLRHCSRPHSPARRFSSSTSATSSWPLAPAAGFAATPDPAATLEKPAGRPRRPAGLVLVSHLASGSRTSRLPRRDTEASRRGSAWVLPARDAGGPAATSGC